MAARFVPILLFLSTCVIAAHADVSPWTQVPLPPTATNLTALAAGAEYLFAAAWNSDDEPIGLFRTSIADPGDWEYLGYRGRYIWTIVVGSGGDFRTDNPVIIGASGDTVVYRSFDSGSTWAGLTIGDWITPPAACHALASNGTFPGRLYAAINDGSQPSTWEGACVSTDIGETWVSGLQIETNYKWQLAAPQDGSDTAYAAVSNLYWMSVPLRSTDGGLSWSSGPCYWENPPVDADVSPSGRCYILLNGGLLAWDRDTIGEETSLPFNLIQLAAPSWSPGRLFGIGTTDFNNPSPLRAASRDEESGEWTAMDEGLPPTQVDVNYEWWKFQLAACADRPILFFAARSAGLWMRWVLDPAAVPVLAVDPAGPWISEPFPNPSAGLIHFRIGGIPPHGGEIEFLDASGRIVHRMTAGRDGTAPLAWDRGMDNGRRAPAGVYWIKLDGSGPEGLRKIIVLD